MAQGFEVDLSCHAKAFFLARDVGVVDILAVGGDEVLERGIGLEDVDTGEAIAYLRGSLGRTQTGSKKASKTMVRITETLNGGHITFLFNTSEVVTTEGSDAEYVELCFDSASMEGH
jgi:hypothetical protein